MKKFPIQEALSLISEGIVDDFVWKFDDQKQAIATRNSITSAVSRRQDGLKVKTAITQAIKNDEIFTFLIIEPIVEDEE